MQQDFYKGNKLLTDPVVKNFHEGKYFDKQTGMMIPLDTGMTKYNIELVRQLNDLNDKFYGLITAYSIMVKILEKDRKYIGTIVNNMYRLIKAHGGTIRYNRAFKRTLREYKVNRKDVLVSLQKNINSQYDRVTRNKELLLDTLEECGLHGVLEALKCETDKDIFEHVVEFTNERAINVEFDGGDNTDAFYESVREDYIQYLTDVAKRNNIDMYKDISEKLLNTLETRKKRAMENKEKTDREKHAAATQKRIAKLSLDNANIQEDYDNAGALIDAGIHGRKFSGISMHKFANVMLQYDTERVYYIAMLATAQIKYYTDKKDDMTTMSISSTKFYIDKAEAEEQCKKLKESTEFRNYTITVLELCLKSPIKQQNTIYGVEKIPIDRIKNIIENRINTGEELEDRELTIRAMRNLFGVHFGIDQIQGRFAVYIAIDEVRDKSVLCNNGQNTFRMGSPKDDNIKIFSVEDAQRIGNKSVNGKLLQPVMININPEWLRNILQLFSDNEHITWSIANYNDVDTRMNDKYGYRGRIEDLEKCKKSGIIGKNKGKIIYYIAFMNMAVNKRYKLSEIDSIKYYKSKNNFKFANTITDINTYDNLEDAQRICESLSKECETNLYRVCTLNLSNIG